METIYIPERHLERDLEVILSFMDEFSFATVVTAMPELRASHIPLFRASADAGFRLFF